MPSPKQVSQVKIGSEYYNLSDPKFAESAAAGITMGDITVWNNKSDFSGSYNDLTDKPEISGNNTYIAYIVEDITPKYASGNLYFTFRNEEDNFTSLTERIEAGQNVILGYQISHVLRSEDDVVVDNYFYLVEKGSEGLLFIQPKNQSDAIDFISIYVSKDGPVVGYNITVYSPSFDEIRVNDTITVPVEEDFNSGSKYVNLWMPVNVSQLNNDADYVSASGLTNYVRTDDIVIPSGITGTAIATVGGKTIYAPSASEQVYNVDIDIDMDHQTGQFINNDSFSSIKQKIESGVKVVARLFESGYIFREISDIATIGTDGIVFTCTYGNGASGVTEIGSSNLVILDNGSIYYDEYYLNNAWNRIYGRPDMDRYVAKAEVSPAPGVTGTVIATIGGVTIYAPVSEEGIQSETDPVFSASAAAGISATDIANWNAATTGFVPVTTTNGNVKTQFITQSSTTGMTLRISDGNPNTHQALLKMESTNESYPKTKAQLLADDILIQGTTIALNGVKTPTNNTDAANKKYVDDQITTAITPYVEKSSVISTGPTNGTAIASVAGITIYAPVAEGGVTVESDPVFTSWATGSGVAAYTITAADVANWNAKSSTTPVNADWNATSGLSTILNKPSIPNAASFTTTYDSRYASISHTHNYATESYADGVTSSLGSAATTSITDYAAAGHTHDGYATIQMISGFANMSDIPYITPEGSGSELIATITQNGSSFGLYAPLFNESSLNSKTGLSGITPHTTPVLNEITTTFANITYDANNKMLSFPTSVIISLAAATVNVISSIDEQNDSFYGPVNN